MVCMKSEHMSAPGAVILGGGLSGAAAAYTLARAGLSDVTLLESGASLGGLAGSFERDGHFYPLGYHHILHRDRALLFFLDLIDALPQVRWRRIRMLFQLEQEAYDLGSLGGFARFPMHPERQSEIREADAQGVRQTGLVRLGGTERCGAGRQLGRPGSAHRPLRAPHAAQIRPALRSGERSLARCSPPFPRGLRTTGLHPRCELDQGIVRWSHSAARRKQAFRYEPVPEFVGFIPRVIASRTLSWIQASVIKGDVFVSSIPTETYFQLISSDQTPELESVRYTALLSVICATRQVVQPDAYWINLASLDRTAGAIFLLSSLNPTIGRPGDTCVNFVTHLPSRDHSLFRTSDEQLKALYLRGFPERFRIRAGAVLDPRQPSSHVFAGVLANVPQRSDPEYLLAERVLRRELPDLSLDRLHRHGAWLRSSSGQRPAPERRQIHRPAGRRRPVPLEVNATCVNTQAREWRP